MQWPEKSKWKISDNSLQVSWRAVSKNMNDVCILNIVHEGLWLLGYQCSVGYSLAFCCISDESYIDFEDFFVHSYFFFHWWSCVMSLSKNRGVIPRLLIIELRCQGVVLFNVRLLVNRYIIPTCMTMKTNGDLSVPKDQKIAARP